MIFFRSILISIFFTLSTYAYANLMAVDLGINYIKVAVARPGKGLELVVNEQAKRKTPAAVAFTEEAERLFGDAAVAYSTKSPNRAILNGRNILGICDQSSTSNPFCQRAKKSIPGLPDLTGEEIIAMQLSMARRQASAALSGAPIKDVAVTVPSWFDERQRLAVIDAASIIGLNCLGVVNANTAAALKYALDGKAKPTEDVIAAEKAKDKKKRTPKTITQRIMFYDLGAGSASASVAEIVSDVKTSSATSVRVLSHASDHQIGGRFLDEAVVSRLADAFDKQRSGDFTPAREIPRVMMRLRKEARRAKEVLSANTESFVSIGSLHDDLDLRATITRADLETDTADMLSLISGPPKQALDRAGLKAKDLDAVVPFGGASRMPRIQDEICKTLGIETLNKSINTDEAAVMGSVFYAASLSSTFRVKKLDFEDVFSRGVSAEIEKESSGGLFSSGKGKKATQNVKIFPQGNAKMPSKKTLSLSRNDDVSLKVFLDLDKSGSVRFPEKTLFASIKVKGVAEVLKKLKDSSKAKNLTPRVAITFHIDRSGLIRIGTAESSVDEKIEVEREVEIKEEKPKTDDKKKADNKSEDMKETKPDTENSKDSETSSEKKEGETNKSESANDKKKDKKKKKKTKIEKSIQTIVHRHTLTVEFEEGEGVLGMQMSGKELEEAKKVLKDLEKADMERMERADALNGLEGYILEIRSKVRGADEDDDLYKVTTEEEREKLVNDFDEAEDWMYTEDAKQTANLRKKHFELQKLYEPMESRSKELKQRPEAFKALLEATEASIKQGKNMQNLHTERKSTKIGEVAKFIEYCETVKTWISDKQSEQEEIPLTEMPKVTIKHIISKADELRKELETAMKLELPPAPKPATEEKKEKNEESSDANSTSTTDDNGEEKVLDNNEDGKVDLDAEAAKVGAASGAGEKDEL